MNKDQLNQALVDKIKKSQLLIADADTGWRLNPANNKIDINVGTFKPGETAPFKVKFEGQKLTISHIKAHCPCTKSLSWKMIEHEDLGKAQIISGTLDILSKPELHETDDNVKKGATMVARYVALDILYAESELDYFLVSDELNFEINPMCFYTRVNIHYNIDLS